MSKETNIDIISDDPELNVLIKEYELLSTKHKQSEDRFFQFISWIITILTTFVGITTSQINNSQVAGFLSWLAWLGPFITVFLFYILLFQYYEVEGLIRKCRIAMDQINQKLKQPVVTEFSGSGEMTKFFSIRHGNIKYRILIWVEIILCGALYLSASTISLVKIYADSHLAGFVFTILFAIATFLLVYTFTGAIVDLSKYYQSIQEQIQSSGRPSENNKPLVLMHSG